MSPEAQRIAIAEACGFKNPKPCPHAPDWPAPGPYGHWFDDENREVPSYLDDLNAMHNAEKVLTLMQQGEYARHLMAVCGTTGVWHEGSTTTLNWFWHATAAQRAEAFLRTIGKWEDT